ncbi:rod shape-determining protein MreD [Zavarzinia sp. CC-PAN008]|uniref:rod shape-determining protein MreD n=1 Tax=Zavarzinia sp. CC-PAN008 TaxID=3243332 RepID=UPI003F749838
MTPDDPSKGGLNSLAPIVVALLCVLLGTIRIGVPHFTLVAAVLPLVAVYYWTIFQPMLMPASGVFLIGLTQDVLGSGPIGLNALILLLVHGFLKTQRRVFVARTFLIAWFGFATIATGAALVSYAVACLFYGTLIQPMPLLTQLVLGIAIYPIGSLVFSRMVPPPPKRIGA